MRILPILTFLAAGLWTPHALAQDDAPHTVSQFLAGGLYVGGGLLDSESVRLAVAARGGPDLNYAPGGWIGLGGTGIQGRLVYSLDAHLFFGQQDSAVKYSGGRAVLSGGWALYQGRSDLYVTIGAGLGGVTAVLPGPKRIEGIKPVGQAGIGYDHPIGSGWGGAYFLLGVRAGWFSSFDGKDVSGPYLQIYLGRSIFDDSPGTSCSSCM